MDPVLSSISIAQHRFLEDSLANHKARTNEEIRSVLISQGLTEAQADQAMRYRPIYDLFIFPEGHTPVLKGYEALTLWKGEMTTLRDILERIPIENLQALPDDFAVLDDHRNAGESDPLSS